MRKKCYEAEVKLVVVKNTLLTKALERVEKADADLVGVLEGSTSIMFTQNAKFSSAYIPWYGLGLNIFIIINMI